MRLLLSKHFLNSFNLCIYHCQIVFANQLSTELIYQYSWIFIFPWIESTEAYALEPSADILFGSSPIGKPDPTRSWRSNSTTKEWYKNKSGLSLCYSLYTDPSMNLPNLHPSQVVKLKSQFNAYRIYNFSVKKIRHRNVLKHFYSIKFMQVNSDPVPSISPHVLSLILQLHLHQYHVYCLILHLHQYPCK